MVAWRGWIHVKILHRHRYMVKATTLGSLLSFLPSLPHAPRSMRTLFLTNNKYKPSRWRVVFVCCLIVALIAGVYSVIVDLIGQSESAMVLLCAVLFGGVVALAYRWLQVRRLQSTARDLKDSALW